MSHFHTRTHPYSLPVLCESTRITILPLLKLPNELLLRIISHVPPPYFEFFVLTCKRIYELASKAIREYNSIIRPLRTLSPYDLHRKIVLDPRLALYPSSLSTWQSDSEFHYSLGLIDKLLSLRRLDIRTCKMGKLADMISYILLAYYEPGPRTLRHPLPLEMLSVVHIQDRAFSIHDTTRTNDALDLSVLLSMIPSVRKLHLSSSLWTWDPYQCPYRCYNGGVTELDLQGPLDSNFAIDLICRTSNLQNFSYRHKLEDGQPPTNFSPRRIVQFLQMEAGNSLTRLKLTLPTQFLSGLDPPLFRRNHSDLFIGSLKRFMTLETLETSVDFLIQSKVVRELRIHGSGKAQKLVKTMPRSLQTLTLDRGLEEWDGLVIRQLFRGLSEDKERCLPSLTVVGFVHCRDLKALLSNHTIRECDSAGVMLCCTS